MIGAAAGNYPKITDQPGGLHLFRAIEKHERGELSSAELEDTFRETVRRVIIEQQEDGLDLITDGLVRWMDLLRPFAAGMEGVEVDGLERFFDNNAYYRKPIVKSRPSRPARGFAVEDFAFARSVATQPLKAVLPGPCTFARLSEDEFFSSKAELVMVVAEMLNAEARALGALGAAYIQLDEPGLVWWPEDIEIAREATAIVFNGVSARRAVSLYFGDCSSLVGQLCKFDVDLIGLDVVSGPRVLEAVRAEGFDRELCLGCVDARNTKLESQDDLCRIFREASRFMPAEKIQVSTNCGLEFLPHDKARKKIRNMTEAVRRFRTAGA
jgi:5-methyltetrahydropteroyltriglutamate--homocysteine methyltransferase